MADEDELPSDLLASMNSLDKTLLGCDEILQTLTKVPLQDSKNKVFDDAIDSLIEVQVLMWPKRGPHGRLLGMIEYNQSRN